MNEPAIQHYHELVSKMDTARLGEISAQFVHDLRAHKACYGERPLSTFLRPQFVTAPQLDLIKNSCRILREAVVKLKEAIFAQPAFLAQLGLSEGERLLCEITGMDNFTMQPAAGAHGELTGVIEGMLRRPCGAAVHGDLVAVPDLAGRVTLLGKDNQLLAQLGDPAPR